MNVFDLIVCLAAALAVWSGWRQGFVVQICTLAGVVVGIWLAARFGVQVGQLLHLDDSVAAAGGFATVLVIIIIGVAVGARLLRKIFHFAGFGALDIALGVAVALCKYLLVVSALFSAFDRLNARNQFADRKTIEKSITYEPVKAISESLLPFLEWVGEQVPKSDK